MKRIRIYQPGDYNPADTVVLSPEASRHVGAVLRMQNGEALTLFAGNNIEYHATIIDASKKSVSVRIDEEAEIDRESPTPIHLVQSISKGDRMEWVMQKAVELGVTTITPIISERTVVRLDEKRTAKKQAQWQAIVQSACEQCGRNIIPQVLPLSSFEDYLQQSKAAIKLILDPCGSQSWNNFDLSSGDIALLIGPEGGFSDAEVSQAKTSGFQALHLGPRILRTETAAIAAISLLQAVCGDL
jgi:16S rRNA (uracil1498-N3)-methyltransferase